MISVNVDAWIIKLKSVDDTKELIKKFDVQLAGDVEEAASYAII